MFQLFELHSSFQCRPCYQSVPCLIDTCLTCLKYFSEQISTLLSWHRCFLLFACSAFHGTRYPRSNIKISFYKLLKNKQRGNKVLLGSFPLNNHPLGFHTRTVVSFLPKSAKSVPVSLQSSARLACFWEGNCCYPGYHEQHYLSKVWTLTVKVGIMDTESIA